MSHVSPARRPADIGDSRVQAKRVAQAEFLAAILKQRQTAGESVAAVGDFNSFQFSDGYVDVMGRLRYSYVFNGETQTVDAGGSAADATALAFSATIVYVRAP